MFSALILLMMNPPLFTQNNTAFRNNLYHKHDNKYNRIDQNLVKGNALDEKNAYVQHNSN